MVCVEVYKYEVKCNKKQGPCRISKASNQYIEGKRDKKLENKVEFSSP